MVAAVEVSQFEGITVAPPDPIVGVSKAFKVSTNEKKLNLGVGAYRTEELQPSVFNVVKKSDNMTDKWHVYMTKDGRISLAGLSAAKCEYLADAIIDSFYNVSWTNGGFC
ncbi:Aspartate aminotransferase, chloroplastic-like protein [Drosera capensis]